MAILLLFERTGTFHRYLIDRFDMAFPDRQKRWTAYNFTLQVYSKFLPAHLKRIRHALPKLNDPRQQSFASDISIEEPDPQRSEPIASSSQERAGFKKPSLPPTARMQQENDRLKDQIDTLLQQQQEQQRQEQQRQEQQRQEQQRQEQQRQQQEQISKLQDRSG